MPCAACMNFVHTGGTLSKGGGNKNQKSLERGRHEQVRARDNLASKPCEAKAKVLPQRGCNARTAFALAEPLQTKRPHSGKNKEQRGALLLVLWDQTTPPL